MLKKIIGKKKILMLVLGIIVGILISVVGVYAATLIDSKNVTYNNTTSKLKATNVQDAIDELYDRVNMPLSSYIVSLYAKSKEKMDVYVGVNVMAEIITQATDVGLLQDDYGNIKYYGASPNNYIIFNKEKWRIIGVFDNKVKIIKDSIGDYAFDTNNKDDWSTATLNTYLNNNYYGTLTNDNSQNMIDMAVWYLGGYDSNVYSTYYTNDALRSEKSTNVYPGNSTAWFGRIALMYPSDYGYATDLSVCKQTITNYGDTTCSDNNWMYKLIKNKNIVTITQFLPYQNVATIINFYGNVSNFYSNSPMSILPTLYLKSDVIITGGDGSEDNPYQIKLN